MENMKFKIRNKEHQDAIIAQLERIGWVVGSHIKSELKAEIYVDRPGSGATFMNIGHENKNYFETHRNRETTLDELFSINLQRTLEINGYLLEVRKTGVRHSSIGFVNKRIIEQVYDDVTNRMMSISHGDMEHTIEIKTEIKVGCEVLTPGQIREIWDAVNDCE